MRALIRVICWTLSRSFCVGLAAWVLSGCAKTQMDYNVLSYDNAIADSANQLLLLNAVRASQHYPRSFTSVGQLQAVPPITGNLASTLTFSGLAGLQGYSLNPTVQASGGY